MAWLEKTKENSSRGSSFSEDFDSFEEEKISDWQTELDDPFFSDSGKGLKNYSA